MKLYAQIGHGLGEKVNQGLAENLIDGAIFSPKDLQRTTMEDRIEKMRTDYPKADIFIDPQFYVSLIVDSPATNIGHISDWNYFRGYRKSELELGKTVDKILEEYYGEILRLKTTGVIAPNIYISQSFDSREAVIAKNFIRQSRMMFDKFKDKRQLYASLIVCREALQDRSEFEEFINDITMMEKPPDGFYLIIAGRASEAKSDFFHTDVLANWMLLNYSLSINGLQVINGYSDVVSPFLGMAGANAGATGWWSNLRMFSMDRFTPLSGGRQTITRYLSKALLNRITFSEKEVIMPFVNSIINGLPHDVDYNPEPERAIEVLQSWEALKTLIADIVTKNTLQSWDNCKQAVSCAEQAYAMINESGIQLDQKSRGEHILPLFEALEQFKERAQL